MKTIQHIPNVNIKVSRIAALKPTTHALASLMTQVNKVKPYQKFQTC